MINESRHQYIIGSLENSTIALMSPNKDLSYSTHCSGVWVSPTHILTARHCVENGEGGISIGKTYYYQIYKNFNDQIPTPDSDKKLLHSSFVLSYDTNCDLALLQAFEGEELEHFVAPIFSGEIYDGMYMYVVGHTFGIEYSVTDGMVANTRQFKVFGMNQKVLQITSLIYGGNSGGGVYNTNGQLIGIVSFSIRKVPGMHFAVHRNLIVDFLDENRISYIIN